ncbi:hypothetical protein [Nocardioides deserti]|uniref:Uncharacterized protein n=1 Tax=Nocardioides deserti TaxID=1588644 RepID=A0ABR6U736_9ACTN|nr:hypothetical protein [Nocardioides deserti]MBC2959958.1 hypothetical protein [Nocardioides deserti]GGO75343.1 hypothetical protein GCM10012276_25510 [Nocardioides deserti]
MTAGLPGTGLGGLLYVLLALFMPLRELYLTARGRSSRERWAVVGRQASLALGVVAALLTTAVVVGRAVDARGPAGGAAGTLLAGAAVGLCVLVVLAVVLRLWALLDRRAVAAA